MPRTKSLGLGLTMYEENGQAEKKDRFSGGGLEELGAGPMAGFHFGEMKFPDSKIGEASVKIGVPETIPAAPPPIAPQIKAPPSAPAPPPRIPVPPPIRARVNVPFGRR